MKAGKFASVLLVIALSSPLQASVGLRRQSSLDSRHVTPRVRTIAFELCLEDDHLP